MNTIQLRILAFVFAAFLPPNDGSGGSGGSGGNEDEEDYYQILNVSRNCTKEEIRKAYRKKSLQYHPDKVAQFARSSNKSPEQIGLDFVKIKEAYEVLSNPQRRNLYDVLGKRGLDMFHEKHHAAGESWDGDYSGGTGGSVGTGLAVDPNAVVQNLANASCVNRTKLFALVLLAVAIVLTGPILLCLKVDSILSRAEAAAESGSNDNDGQHTHAFILWVYVLIPFWIFQSIALILSILNYAFFISVKIICIFILQILLALQWDGFINWSSYSTLLIPLYVYFGISIVEYWVTIRQVRSDVARMVTVSYLEEKILPTFKMDDDGDGDNDGDDHNEHGSGGMQEEEEKIEILNENTETPKRYYNDLTEEEKDFLNELYIIVTDNEDDNDDDENNNNNDSKSPYSQLDPEIKVLFDIADSPEFQYAASLKNAAHRNLFFLITSRLPFLILLVLQLERSYHEQLNWDWNWDWNIVFLPIWIELGISVFWNCFVCCCAGDGGITVDALRKRGSEDASDCAKYHDIDLEEQQVEKVDVEENVHTNANFTVKSNNGPGNVEEGQQQGQGQAEKTDGVKSSLILSGTADANIEAGVDPSIDDYRKEDDGKESYSELLNSESGFAPVSYSPLIKPDDQNDDDDDDNDESNGSSGNDHHNSKKSSLEETNENQQKDFDNDLRNNNNDKSDDDVDIDEAESDDEYEYADQEILQRQSQAVGHCCTSILQIIILSLFITKLNGSGTSSENGSIGNYSSFWVIFPVFFFSGLLLCLCGICIYARPEKLKDMVNRRSTTTAAKNDDNDNTDGPTTTAEVNAAPEAEVFGPGSVASLGGDSDDLD